MPANLENSAAATGLEKVSFHSNPKERQCQRMLMLLLSHCSRVNLCANGSPPGSPIPGILQAKTPEWVAISFSKA